MRRRAPRASISSAVSGSPEARRRAFERAYRELELRILAFLALRPDVLDRPGLQQALDAIGRRGQAGTA